MKKLKSWIGFFLLVIIVCNTSYSATYKFETVNSMPQGVGDSIKKSSPTSGLSNRG